MAILLIEALNMDRCACGQVACGPDCSGGSRKVMTVFEKLGAIRTDLRALAKQCVDSDDDDICAIMLLKAAEAVTDARNKLSEYGLDACDVPTAIDAFSEQGDKP